jgi:hypothetical protein
MLSALPVTLQTTSLDQQLAAVSAFVARLVRDGSPREIVDARRDAEALRSYAEKAKLGMQAQNAVAQARLDLECRLGELIPIMIHRGRPKSIVSDDTFVRAKLADWNISPDLSSRSQRVAQIPAKYRQQYFAQAKELGFEITNRDFFVRIEANRVNATGRDWAMPSDNDEIPAWQGKPVFPALGNWKGKRGTGQLVPHRYVDALVDIKQAQANGTSTFEWYTPPEIFEALGVRFDLDVCSPGLALTPWIPARRCYTRADDGLAQRWYGFVWMNPVFGLRNGIMNWITRFIAHGKGVALVSSFTSTDWYQHLTGNADAIMLVNQKIQFLPRQIGRNNAIASTLVAIGRKGIRALENAERNGWGTCFDRRRITN